MKLLLNYRLAWWDEGQPIFTNYFTYEWTLALQDIFGISHYLIPKY